MRPGQKTSGAVLALKVPALLPWVASAAMAGLGVWHLSHASTAFSEWRRWRVADPSLADFFWTEFEIELALTTGCVVIAGACAIVARQMSKLRERRTSLR